ncbi:MAG: hypothetical protein J0H49_15725 [Acidobacteria bacterium]|nr:hypothetical protein [Acidobacteriota bacterium]
MFGRGKSPVFLLAMSLAWILVSPLPAQVLLDSYTAEQLEKLGEARYESGKPDLALPLYAKALEKDPARVPSLVAAARILESGFQRDQAVVLFRRALAIDPKNLEALSGLSRTAPTWQERRSATQNLAAAGRGAQARLARLQLRQMEALGDRPTFETVDPARSYSFQLEDPGRDVPPGMTVPVLTIDTPDGHKLKLLIATAIEGIWLRKSAAKALGARILFPSAYPWVAQGDLLDGDFGIIDRLHLGELTLLNCPVFVRHASRSYMYGVDGIIGAEVFKDFRVELGNSAADLVLVPHAQEDPVETSRYFLGIRRYGPFLLAPVQINPEQASYFAVSNITSEVILQMGKLPAGVKQTGGGLTYPLTGWLCSSARTLGVFRLKATVGPATWKGEATSCKMPDLNRAVGFPVAGILGYSFLSGYTLVLDYRHGRAGFLPQAARRPGLHRTPNPGETWPTTPSGQ